MVISGDILAGGSRIRQDWSMSWTDCWAKAGRMVDGHNVGTFEETEVAE